MDSTTRTLAQIAAASGFNMADVAHLAELGKPHVGKLWEDPECLDKATGKTLQALIRILPGIASYMCNRALGESRNKVSVGLERCGLAVDERVFQRLVAEHVPEQYLTNALGAAVQIMTPNVEKAAAHLTRFWGRRQDYALGFLFDSTPGQGILVDAGPLVEASASMADKFAAQTMSFHAMMAHATLIHHVAKARGTALGQDVPSRKPGAFAYRSAAIGMIIRTNDVAASQRYGHEVRDSGLLKSIERWSFPTYTRDAPVTRDFTLPNSLLLTQTAAEVVRELGAYPDAYVHYLTSVYLPLALEYDRTFGLQLAQLLTVIRQRRETTQEPAVARACDDFLSLAR